MRRFIIPLLVASLVSCASTPPKLVETPAEPQQTVDVQPHATHLDKPEWSITLPVGWTYDDVPKLGKASTRLLTATSKESVGRAQIKLMVDSVAYNKSWPEEIFASLVAEKSETLLDATKVQSELLDIDGHPTSVTLLINPEVGAGMLMLATGRSGTGYVVTCVGDAVKPAGSEVAKTCLGAFETFHVK